MDSLREWDVCAGKLEKLKGVRNRKKRVLSMMGTINVVNRISKKESNCQEVALIVQKEWSYCSHNTKHLQHSRHNQKEWTKKIIEVKGEQRLPYHRRQ